jgi:hypothetical protein
MSPRLLLATLTLGIAAAVTAADDPTQRVHFEAGATSATLSGEVIGYRSLRYLLAGRAGQALAITFEPSKQTLFYDVSKGTQRLRNGSSEKSPQWTATLPADGDYIIDVYLKSGDAKKNVQATFTLNLALSNTAAR